MAYLDPASAFSAAGAIPSSPPEGIEREEFDGFTPLEWSVIALARRDRVASLSAPGPIARALGGIFGLGRQSALADPRLEALRRVAVHAWHRGYALPVSEIKGFLGAGFSSAQLETMLASVANGRVRRVRGGRA